MVTVGAFEAKTHLSRLIDQVVGGEQVTITRHGVPVARLVPVENADDNTADVVRLIREFSKGKTLGRATIKSMIEEGRRY